MAYDEKLAERVRNALGHRDDVFERKMFGGLAFMLHGNMACGVMKNELMLRLGPEAAAKSLKLKHARAMDFTGRPMTGMLYVWRRRHQDGKTAENLAREVRDFR